MRFKKILYILAAVTMVIFVALYAGFLQSNQQEATEKEERQVIRVLAPYQGRCNSRS